MSLVDIDSILGYIMWIFGSTLCPRLYVTIAARAFDAEHMKLFPFSLFFYYIRFLWNGTMRRLPKYMWCNGLFALKFVRP